MKKYKEIKININEKTKREAEIEDLAMKLNVSREEIMEELSNMYIKEGAKYEEYFRNT